MMVDINQIPYDEIKPNSILVVRLFSGTQSDLASVDAWFKGFRDRIPPSVTVLVMRDDTEIFNVDEELMNRMGWFKTKSAETPPSS